MKVTGSICVLATLAAAAIWLLAESDFVEPAYAAEVPAETSVHALESAEPKSEPIAVVATEAEAPAAEEVHEVVDPIEDRRDAMLWEIDALGGTPFDESIVMPFD